MSYSDRFRLSCLDKKIVDSWNHPLHLGRDNHLASVDFPLPGKPRSIIKDFFPGDRNLAVMKGTQ